MDVVSTNVTNTVSKNVSTNPGDKKVRYTMDCYILHTVLLVIILLFIIAIIWIMPNIDQNLNIKMENWS